MGQFSKPTDTTVIHWYIFPLQLINIEYNGTVEKKEVREDGQHTITIDNKSPLFKYVCFVPFCVSFQPISTKSQL